MTRNYLGIFSCLNSSLRSHSHSLLKPSILVPFAHYSSQPFKVDIKLVSQLRKATECSMTKAKEALVFSKNNYDGALEWLEKDRISSGAKKAEKLKDRKASEGWVTLLADETGGVSLVELNCETDFVARSPVFMNLAGQLCLTASVLGSSTPSKSALDVKTLLEAPVMPAPTSTLVSLESKSISQSILDAVTQLGENIQFSRAHVFDPRESTIIGSYVHSSGTVFDKIKLGRMASAVVLRFDASAPLSSETRKELQTLANKLSQHVLGCQPVYLAASSPEVSREECLLTQDFLFGGGCVSDVLSTNSKTLGLSSLQIESALLLRVGSDPLVL